MVYRELLRTPASSPCCVKAPRRCMGTPSGCERDPQNIIVQRASKDEDHLLRFPFPDVLEVSEVESHLNMCEFST